MDFKNIPNKYRPIPFWSWNEKLNTEETARQIELMNDVGIGGFFMHARGGLQTEYMGEEWFENVSTSIERAKQLGMYAWAYDENGWPSGFGNGIVNGVGVKFQQKYLRYEDGEKQTDTTICNVNGIHFYYDINPFYVDTLNPEAIKMFIEEIYQPYYDKYQNGIEGFFTDEPQISRNGIPWSLILPEEYKKEYNDDLLRHLIELFKPIGDYKTTRMRFWRLITNLFSKNFMKQIYDWCNAHNVKFTGHLVLEESLDSQLITNGAVMPHYEYFDMPGMDWLGRNISKCLTPLQVSSVAHQLGKKQILSETFALCGHNVGHDELKGILEWQMVNGITQLCQHLEGYSLRGIRKRDYPPAMYYQQPWWSEYKVFNDAMSRIGMLLSQGEVEYDTLLIHPQTTAWILYDNDKNEGLDELNQALLDTMDLLNEKHILYHLGDETIMERHAAVEGDELVIGTQRYKTIVLPQYEVLFDNTKRLLQEFEANGGRIVKADELEENPIISCKYINYTKRKFEDFDLYYFVNTSTNCYDTTIAVGSKIMDIKTGELTEFDGTYSFGAYESLVVIDDGEVRSKKQGKSKLEQLDLGGEWNIKQTTPNSITLDYCDYYFDGQLVEKNAYVLNIQHRACSLKRPVDIKCEYMLECEYIPQDICLVCETPEIFDIEVNGKAIDKTQCGCFVDSSFKKIKIADYLRTGKNVITLSVKFEQSDRVYENLEKSKVFESEKNKLTYDVEIEPIYVIGDFSVKCDGTFIGLDKNACRYNGGFIIEKPRDTISLSNIEKQGYPFFAGSITLEKIFDVDSTDYEIAFAKKGVNAVKVKVNDGEEKTIMWEPLSADISKYLKKGQNKVEITLVNNLRNLLGPHHLAEGESYAVGPNSFYKEACVWTGANPPEWDDGYCFAEFGISRKD